jgi:hypothetical protein
VNEVVPEESHRWGSDPPLSKSTRGKMMFLETQMDIGTKLLNIEIATMAWSVRSDFGNGPFSGWLR